MKLFREIVRRSVSRSGLGVSGQSLVEYMVMAGMMLATVAILAVFMYTFKGHSGRVLDLVASEYP